jgi:hypothetical protein
MIKSKLLKALMLGLCMSALTTGAAFAQAVAGTTPADRGEVQVDDALYEKQKDIDQYVFIDHVKEIEDMGFMINTTGVVDDMVEIGISPYTEENADYLYGIFGKDSVKVVEFDLSVIYASGVADPAVTEDGTTTSDEPSVKEEMQANDVAGSSDDGKVYKGGDVEIQIESTDVVAPDAGTEVDPEVIYQTTSADDADIKTVSTAEGIDELKRGTEEDESGVATPIIVLAIAGGAALVGGAIILSNKKKVSK